MSYSQAKMKIVMACGCAAAFGLSARTAVAQTSGINVDWGLAQQQAATTGDMANNANQGAASGYALAVARRQQLDEARAAQQWAAQQQLRRSVGSLVSEGRCGDARKIALQGGDFQLASLVVDACHVPPRSTPGP
jgi:hypothetical protein